MEMKFKTLQFEESSEIGMLSIHRSQALNALNSEVFDELESFTQENLSEKIKVLIIRGGEKAFVVGADLKEMAHFDSQQAEAFARKGQAVFSLIENLPFPVIALIQGFALGGGLELALSCDMIVMEEKAQVGFPEVKLSLFPSFGGTQKLCRTVGFHKAKEMILSGATYSAQEALVMGLANFVFPSGELMERTVKWAEHFKKNGLLAMAKAKSLLNQSVHFQLEDGLKKEAKEFGILFESEDAKEGIQAFIEKRKAKFKGR